MLPSSDLFTVDCFPLLSNSNLARACSIEYHMMNAFRLSVVVLRVVEPKRLYLDLAAIFETKFLAFVSTMHLPTNVSQVCLILIF